LPYLVIGAEAVIGNELAGMLYGPVEIAIALR